MHFTIFVFANDHIPIDECLYDDSIKLTIDPSVAFNSTLFADLNRSFAVDLVTNHLTFVLTAQSQTTPVSERYCFAAILELHELALSFLKSFKPFWKILGVVGGTFLYVKMLRRSWSLSKEFFERLLPITVIRYGFELHHELGLETA